jgi:hypothetical protein
MSSYGSCRRAPSFVARLGQLAHPRQTVRHRAFRVHRRASRELSARSQPWLVSLRLGGAAERARAAVRLRASLASASRRASWNLMAGSLPRVHRRWRGEPQKGCQTWDSSCCRAAAPSPDAARLQAASGRRHRRCAARAEPQATRGRPAPAASGPRQAGGRRQAAAGRRPRRRGAPAGEAARVATQRGATVWRTAIAYSLYRTTCQLSLSLAANDLFCSVLEFGPVPRHPWPMRGNNFSSR